MLEKENEDMIVIVEPKQELVNDLN